MMEYARRHAELEREREAAQLLLAEANERLAALQAGKPATDADPGDENDGQPLPAPARRLSRDRQRQADRLAKIRAGG